MRYSLAAIAAFAASTSAHGVITAVQGANGVTMPGLSGKLSSLPVIGSIKIDTDMINSSGRYSP